MLRRAFFVSLGVATASAVAGVVAFLWPSRRAAGVFDAGAAAGFAVGDVSHFQVRASSGQLSPQGASLATELRDFHLVRRPDGFAAFWHRCTHQGCTVPYRPEFEFRVQDRVEKGLFRCPCHGSTFSRDEGEVVFGPAERPLDALPVRVEDGRVLVTVREGAERVRRHGERAAFARA